ncbi:MAG TPA: hypothetical protein VGJ62_01110 [Gemmatimonadaceae bacterium]|jgi:hypothetical protein
MLQKVKDESRIAATSDFGKFFGIEMTPLDFAVEAGLFTLLLGIIVLLALFEQPVRRIVVS